MLEQDGQPILGWKSFLLNQKWTPTPLKVTNPRQFWIQAIYTIANYWENKSNYRRITKNSNRYMPLNVGIKLKVENHDSIPSIIPLTPSPPAWELRIYCGISTKQCVGNPSSMPCSLSSPPLPPVVRSTMLKSECKPFASVTSEAVRWYAEWAVDTYNEEKNHLELAEVLEAQYCPTSGLAYFTGSWSPPLTANAMAPPEVTSSRSIEDPFATFATSAFSLTRLAPMSFEDKHYKWDDRMGWVNGGFIENAM